MISVENISKSFGKKGEVIALENITLNVKKGEIFGLIGPDGAGKTTLFRILTTLMLPDSGHASVNNFDVVTDYKELRKILGYMPGRFSLYQDLTVQENLDFFATIFDTSVEENYYLIEDIYVQLAPFKDRRAGALSGGMKQKLALCCALIHKPTVLFLDEPTTGVDVVSRKEFWAMLKRLQETGITIFVSTPYMDEAILCDRIALMQNGHILKLEKPDDIIRQYQHLLLSIRTNNIKKAIKDIKLMDGQLDSYLFGEMIHSKFSKTNFDMNKIINFLKEKGHQNIDVDYVTPTIEDCFLDLMQK